MVITCEIKYDNEYGICHSGQTIAGSIKLTVEKPIKIKGVCLKIAGFGFCIFTEYYGRVSITYSGREDYLQNTRYLIGDHEGQIELPPGIHTYEFSCAVPESAPTSVEEACGKIRYSTKVILERPWKFDISFKNTFTVIKELDLNLENPPLNIPIAMEESKSFWFTTAMNNSFNMRASVPMTGFVSGQIIRNIKVEINNQTSIEILYLKISLRKYVSYKSKFPWKKSHNEMRTIHAMKLANCQKNEFKQYNEIFRIPVTSPTNWNTNEVIRISYEMQFKAKVSGAHKSPVIRFPVTIGTRPLYILPPPDVQGATSSDYFSRENFKPSFLSRFKFKVCQTYRKEPNLAH
jgi:hypothetical protein